jgi:hypothetical protein
MVLADSIEVGMQFLRSRADNAPNGVPKIKGTAGFAWEVPPGISNMKVAYLLEAPWYNPVCAYWFLCGLREEEGPPPKDAKTLDYHLVCSAIDTTEPLPNLDVFRLDMDRVVTTQTVKLRLLGDAELIGVCDYLTTHVVGGYLNPCQEYAMAWIQLCNEYIRKTKEH